jgi:hypothetical protein
LIWLIATRRYRTAGMAAVASLLLVIVPWAGISFAGLGAYPYLLANVSSSEGPRSYSIAALLHAVVPNWTAATAMESVFGAGLLLVVIALGRRGRGRDAFACAIVTILVFTPLLEMHYFAALLVIVALYQRQFGLAWVAPLLIWGAPATVAGSAIQVVHVLVVVAATVALAVVGWSPQKLARGLKPEPV